MGKKKKDGKIFTPKPVVMHMLYDLLAQRDGFEKKHIIDNSCGDGAFLCEIVGESCALLAFQDDEYVRNYLETYIHGIELDPVEYRKCLNNLDEVAQKWGFSGIKWDIQNRDALSCHDYDGKMDYVIANPPYIRTHDLDCDLSGYTFTSEGMKDIYLAFYELGFRMLNETGQMCYITPSSWFTSGAGRRMRGYIIENQNLAYVEDYGHTQVFENATTYVAITKFNKEKNETVKYVSIEETGDKDGYRKSLPLTISWKDMIIDGKFYFGTKKQLDWMWEISEYSKGLKKEDKAFEVKNGYATLADDVFIDREISMACNKDYAIPVIKASTGVETYCIYPYDRDGKLISEEHFKLKSGFDYNRLLRQKEKLEARATDEPWYAFGRTQAINDTYKDKWAVKSIVKKISDCQPVHAPAGTGVYGGLYILPKNVEGDVQDYLMGVLKSQDFLNYVKMLGKYKSGGYYTFSSKELENYLNWSYGKKKD